MSSSDPVVIVSAVRACSVAFWALCRSAPWPPVIRQLALDGQNCHWIESTKYSWAAFFPPDKVRPPPARPRAAQKLLRTQPAPPPSTRCAVRA